MTRHLVWLALAACGGTLDVPDAAVDATTDVTDAAPETSIDSAPACVRVDASNCYTGEKSISCEDESGAGALCLGDAGDNCGYGFDACTYGCDAGEYAAWCGGPPPQVGDPPSPACRSWSGLPNGTVQYCCPCE